MSNIAEIIAETSHRTWEIPSHKWSYYQEWSDVIFLHWRVPLDELRKVVPSKLQIDTINGEAWVSLVPFTMENIRLRGLPAIDLVSHFHEINLRTYVIRDNKPGVYFLNIEASKLLSVWVAKTLSGLPYEKASIRRSENHYASVNKPKAFFLDLAYAPQQPIHNKSELDTWLTERYCLYVENGGNIFRFDIHHKPWKLQEIVLQKLQLKYKIGALHITSLPEAAHYSAGVKVIAWNKKKV